MSLGGRTTGHPSMLSHIVKSIRRIQFISRRPAQNRLDGLEMTPDNRPPDLQKTVTATTTRSLTYPSRPTIGSKTFSPNATLGHLPWLILNVESLLILSLTLILAHVIYHIPPLQKCHIWIPW